eukprot:bmy_05069T0
MDKRAVTSGKVDSLLGPQFLTFRLAVKRLVNNIPLQMRVAAELISIVSNSEHDFMLKLEDQLLLKRVEIVSSFKSYTVRSTNAHETKNYLTCKYQLTGQSRIQRVCYKLDMDSKSWITSSPLFQTEDQECPGRGLRSGHRAEAASCKQRRRWALPEATRTASETVKNRSKKSSKKKNPSSSSSSSKLPPVCYEIITLKTKKKKTAADIFRRRKPANSSSTTVHQYHQQNLSNHNLIPAPNWQGLYPTITERNAVMFNNDLMADVHFVVGPPGGTQQLPGHKYVLAVGSSVFYAMFYGELAEDKGEIRIPDVDPAAFLAMLKYIYCDEMDLAAVTVLATLYAAKKYIVPHLARACVNLLETSLSAKNACVLLSQSCLFEEPGLTQRCWEVIDVQAELALKSEGFCDIDLQTLENILRRETECQRNCGFRGSSRLG